MFLKSQYDYFLDQSYCTGPAGRTESLGRRKRDAEEEYTTDLQTNDTNSTNEEERLREMIKVNIS